MDSDVQRMAALAHIDEKLDEMHEELGDLPKQVKKLESTLRDQVAQVESTQKALADIEHFRNQSHIVLQEFTDKEAKLGDTQFSVRNNKEFDAITKEIEFIRQERMRIDTELGQHALKDENLKNALIAYQAEVLETQTQLTQKEQELEHLSSEQNAEFKTLQTQRKKIVSALNPDWYVEYERIRTFHSDAAVHTRKGSCSGCFSAIPPQKQVEMRNSKDAFFTCQICGRILYPEGLHQESEE